MNFDDSRNRGTYRIFFGGLMILQMAITPLWIKAQPIAEGFDHHVPAGTVLADGDTGEKIFRTRASRFAWGGHCQTPGKTISFGTKNTETYLGFNGGAWIKGNYAYTRFDSDTEPASGANLPSRTIDMSDEGSRIVLSLFENSSNVNASVLLRDKDHWWRSSPFTIVRYSPSYNAEKRITLDPGDMNWTRLENTGDMDQVDDGGDSLLVDGETGDPDWSSIEGMGIMAMINIPSARVYFSGMSLTDGSSNKVPIGEPFKNSDVAFLHKPTPLEKFDEYGGAKAVYWSQGWNKDYTALSLDYGVRDIPVINLSVVTYTIVQNNPEMKASMCRDLWGNEVTIGSPAFPNGMQARMCIRKPDHKQYIHDYGRMRVYNVGAREAIIDSPLGSNGSPAVYRNQAGCFCDDCNDGFRDWLAGHYTAQELADMGIGDVSTFSYRDHLRGVVSGLSDYKSKLVNGELPFMDDYIKYQEAPARQFFIDLREYLKSLDPSFTLTANTYNLQQPSLYLVEEVDNDFHGAEAEIYMNYPQRFGIHMQRLKLADALGIRIVSSGGHWNWEYARANGLVDAIKPIIAAHYASGHQLAVPDLYRWIEPDWYGPIPEYAPYYRFVRENAGLFDDYVAVEQVGVVMDNSVSGLYNGNPTFKNDYENIGMTLLDHTVPFGIAAGADGTYLTREFTREELEERFETVILPRDTELEGNQLTAVNELHAFGRIYYYDGSMGSMLDAIDSWVDCDKDKVWVLPRVHAGDTLAPVVVHMLNRDISIANDMVIPKSNLKLNLSKDIIRKPVHAVQSYSPGTTPATLDFTQDGDGIEISVPGLEYWNVLRIIYSGTPANVQEPAAPEPHIYPNPARDRLYIDGLLEKSRITVRSLNGGVVSSGRIDPGGSYEIGGLKSGMYLIQIENSAQNIYEKLIKE